MLNGIMTQVIAKRATAKLLRQAPIVIRTAAVKPAICGLVQMPAAPILTALQKFPEDFGRYVDGESLTNHHAHVSQ